MKNRDHENEQETRIENTDKHSSLAGSVGLRSLYCLPKLSKESSSVLAPSTFLPFSKKLPLSSFSFFFVFALKIPSPNSLFFSKKRPLFFAPLEYP